MFYKPDIDRIWIEFYLWQSEHGALLLCNNYSCIFACILFKSQINKSANLYQEFKFLYI